MNYRLVPAALTIVGGVFVYLITAEYGPGVSTDAAEYLSAAESFSKGTGFINYKGEPYHLWSPLYPFLLGVPQVLIGIDPLLSGWVLNIVTFGLIIWMSWLVVGRAVPDRPIWAFLGALVVLFSESLLGVAANIASDPIFIVMLLGFFLLFDRYIRTGNFNLMVGLTLVSGLAAVQRYLGVTLILAGFIGIIYFRRSNLRKAYRSAVGFSLFASLPVLSWVLRNWFLTDTFFGVRDPSKWLLGENLIDAFLKIFHWFLPFTLVSNRIFLVIALALMVLGISRINSLNFTGVKQRFNEPILFIILVFSLIYLVLILILTKTEDHPEIYDDRYYTPIFIPILILIFLVLQSSFFSGRDESQLHLRHWFLVLGFSLWLVYPAYNTYKLWSKTRTQKGVPHYNLYNLPLFRESPVTRALDDILPEVQGPIYSNYSAAVYLYTRRQVASSPTKRGEGDSRTPLEAYTGTWPEEDGSLLIWYEPNTKAYLYTPQKLKAVGDLEVLFESRRGGIYSVNPTP